MSTQHKCAAQVKAINLYTTQGRFLLFRPLKKVYKINILLRECVTIDGV